MRSFKRPTTYRVNRPIKINLAIMVGSDISAPKDKIVHEIRTYPVCGSVNINLSITVEKEELPTKKKTGEEIPTGVNPTQDKPMNNGRLANNERVIVADPEALFKNKEVFTVPKNISKVKLYKPLDCNYRVPLSNKRVTSLFNLFKEASSSLAKHHEGIARHSIPSNSIIPASPKLKPVGSAMNAVLCNFAPFLVSNPHRFFTNTNSNSARSDPVGQKAFVQHTAVSSAMSNATWVSLEGLLRNSTSRPPFNRHRSLGDFTTMPASTSVRRETFMRNSALPPAMSKAIRSLLEDFSRRSIHAPVIEVSRQTSSVDSNIHATIGLNYRGFIIDLEPSMWKMFGGIVNSIAQKRLVISSTSNLTKQLGFLSSRISHSLELEPQYSEPQYDASQFVVPSIILSSFIFPQQSIATASSFHRLSSKILSNVGDKIPCRLELEPAQRTMQYMTQRYSASPIKLLELDIPAPSTLTPSQFAPISGASLSLTLEPSCFEPQDKVPESAISQTDMSDKNILEPSILANFALLPSAETPIILGLEHKRLVTQSEAPKCIIPLLGISGMKIVRSFYSATSSTIPPSISKILHDASSENPPPQETEPADLATQCKTPKCYVSSINLSTENVPASFPSAASFYQQAFAQTTRKKPSKDRMALEALQEKLALHLQKHEEIKARAKKATSRLQKIWTCDTKYRRCSKAKKRAEKVLQSSLDKKKCLHKEEAELNYRISLENGFLN